MKHPAYFSKFLEIIWQIPVWGFMFSLPFLLYSFTSGSKLYVAYKSLNEGWFLLYIGTSLIWVFSFYVNVNFLIPVFAYRRKFWAFLFVQLLFILLILSITPLLFWAFSEIEGLKGYSLSIFTIILLIPYLFILGGSMFIQLVKTSFHFDQLAREIESENEKLKTEVTFLRNGAIPNLVYDGLKIAISGTQNKQIQPEASLAKLFSLVDYTIRQPISTLVPLQKEIDLFKNYIDLREQSANHKIMLHIAPDINTIHYEIKSMQLIPFVEEFLKHKNNLGENKLLEIWLTIKRNMLQVIINEAPRQATQNLHDNSFEITSNYVKRKLLINCFQKSN